MAKKDLPTREDLVRLFAENAGVAMTDRQLKWAALFVSPGRCFRNSTAAARAVGYPDPETAGDDNYSDFCKVLHDFMEKEDMFKFAVLDKTWQLMNAQVTKPITHQGLLMDTFTTDDNTTQLGATKLMSEFLGMKAPDRLDANLNIKSVAEELREAAARAGVLGE